MEYNTFQHQDQTNFEGMHAQELHMNDIAYKYHLCPDLKKKKIDLPTLPIFQAKRSNKPFIILGLMNDFV